MAMNADRMNPGDRPYPGPDVASIDLGAETLVYDGVVLHLLTGTAAVIWRLADGGHSAVQIADEVTSIGSDRPEDVHRDVMDFLRQLTEQGLLAPIGPGTSIGAETSPGYVRPDYVGYVLDGPVVLIVDLRDGRRQALNSTGARVWELTCQHSDPATVLTQLRAEYPDAPATLETEVAALLEELLAAGLLVPVQNAVDAQVGTRRHHIRLPSWTSFLL